MPRKSYRAAITSNGLTYLEGMLILQQITREFRFCQRWICIR